MELRHLRYFVAVADAGSLTVAAEQKLHTSQPSLSRQIRDLEEEVGVQLLNRGAQGIELTAAGKAFLDHARMALLQAEAAKEAALRAARPPKPARTCIFEYIYFARPDSIVGGRSVYDVRKAFGAQLARESHPEVDVVVPVPDSGVPAAVGYSQYSGVPFELGIIRNHYVGRTFIQPTQTVRELGVRMKHSANRAAIEGKRIILIDDSLVRGTTSKKIVRMMRDAGAREVHFRLASPPILYPDYYGIDLPDRGGLLAATHSLEEMRDIIGADSLAFLSIDGMYRAMGYEGRDPASPKFADHCFTGAYPTHLTDQSETEPSPRQLSLLAEAS